MKPVAFIDADIILHRAVSFVDTEFDGEEMVDWKLALYFYDYLLDKWLKEAGDLKDYYQVLSVGGNFRKKLYPEYKANRKEITPHPALSPLRDEIMDRMGVIWEEGIEADDLIGIRCTEDSNTLAISADKDFKTVPCKLMIPSSHGRTSPDWFEFNEEEANRNWLIQAMTGDVVDNYSGIPMVGEVAAIEAVDNPRITQKAPTEYFKRGPRKGQEKPVKWIKGDPCDRWTSMVTLAQSKDMTEDGLILMAQLARILRHGEYDFDKKEVKLWYPK